MPWKGKQPRCKTCGHVHFKHRPIDIDKFCIIQVRGRCTAKGCDCKKYIPENKYDHRWE